MKIALICPPLQGHINPMSAIAIKLKNTGYNPVFFGLPDVSRYIKQFDFIEIGQKIFPWGSIPEILKKMTKKRGIRMGMLWQREFSNKWSNLICDQLPIKIKQENINFIICDQLEPAVALVADHLNIPFITVCNAMAIVMDLSLPPFFTNWNYKLSDTRLKMNKGFYMVADLILKHDTRALEKWRIKWGMEERTGMKRYFAVSNIATLSQQTKSLEYPLTFINKDWHYCGPFRSDGQFNYLKPDIPEDNIKNVFISLGTLQGSRYKLIKLCVDSCAESGLRPIVAHAGMLKPNQVKELEKKALVFAYIEQLYVLKKCELLISHCGLNTGLDALSLGIPIIAIPLGIEQGAIAAKFQRVGCAIVLKRFKKMELLNSITVILSDPKYKKNSQFIKEEIKSSLGVEKAVEIIDSIMKRI